MKTLISMTDFVLQDWSKHKGYYTEDYRIFAYNKVVIFENYAKFLKQPLTLGMFIPCGENDKPVLIQYDSMVQKVLFKGFSPCKVNDSQVTYTQKSGITFNMLIDGTIEDMIWLSREKFELTESAIKQITG